MTPKHSETMNGSWFFDENFNGVPDEFFDDLIKQTDFPLEGLEPNNEGEDWEVEFQSLEPPPANILASLSNGFCEDAFQVSERSGNEPKVKPWLGTSESSSRQSIDLQSDASDEKHSRVFQTSSPVSVLENSSSSLVENPISYHPKFIPVKRPRNKRPRPLTFNPCRMIPFITSTFLASRSHSLAASESESETYHVEKTLDVAKKKQKKKKNLTLLSCTIELEKSSSRRPSSQPPGPTRKCTHCEVTKTPQWREGPLGPKTLCNACGVRYRSGSLLPEYRPVASPTFVPSLHSNSHRKVVQMRTKACQLPTTMASSG
ncbi:GATA transcription factor 11-like isoform X1 [Tripterygium wilfordii]|uniref:GATA transcription factor 11-like isoform X1 n=1 Tax=Tripterygium wilfordii TaxID=458696 RepID=UPI0018F81399|nr:GATA transcription factor 11-like isoform X1 [Tripterygium wilfordii]